MENYKVVNMQTIIAYEHAIFYIQYFLKSLSTKAFNSCMHSYLDVRSSGGVTASVVGTGVDSNIISDALGVSTGVVAAERHRQQRTQLYLNTCLNKVQLGICDTTCLSAGSQFRCM